MGMAGGQAGLVELSTPAAAANSVRVEEGAVGCRYHVVGSYLSGESTAHVRTAPVGSAGAAEGTVVGQETVAFVGSTIYSRSKSSRHKHSHPNHSHPF